MLGAGWLRIILAPLLGAIIGYITNDIALKMLFHPYEEVRIGRFRVPFTPGLIPRQKARIARSLGGIISDQLLDVDTLRREALSDAALEKLRGVLNGWLEAQCADERPLRERIEVHVEPERLAEVQGALTDRAADFLVGKLRGAGLGGIVAEQVLQAIRGRIGGHIGFLLDGALEPLRTAIAAAIENKIAREGPALVRAKLSEAGDALLDKSVAELSADYRERIPELTEALLRLYQGLFENHIGELLRAIHLDEIVERKINSFDARQLEHVVFGVVRRELRAIVYLGAALGFAMGFINLLF